MPIDCRRVFSTDCALRTAPALTSAALALLLTGCVSEQLPPSIWPPPDFSLTVEEVRLEGRAANVIRRFRVGADGVAVYGTSSQPLVDGATGVSLPVFDRLAVYQLEPDCVRALARRLDRLGITEIEGSAADENGAATTGIVRFYITSIEPEFNLVDLGVDMR